MISRIQKSTVWLFCAATSLTYGNEPSSHLSDLAQHPQWQALLHYESGGLLRPAQSAVLDDAFFLSESGRNNPYAELLATYTALKKGGTNEKADHCHFPARALWLAEHTDIDSSVLQVCDDWLAWEKQHQDATVGLVFATGYLGNPASFFGHLLLHIGSKPASSHGAGNRLLDTSLNFGADVPPEDGIITYMAKGLFGGYQARFSNAPFYRNSTLYSEREMRDLWHYEIDLDAHQIRLLTAHLFEIMGRNFSYRFLTENCASQIARILDQFTDQPVSSAATPWIAPETVLRNIDRASIDGRPAVSQVTHIPSRRLITEQHFMALGERERLIATEIAANLPDIDLAASDFWQLPQDSQRAILEAVGSYIAYRRRVDPELALGGAEQTLLMARLNLPPAQSALEFTSPKPITEIPPGGRLQLKAVHTNERGNGVSLSLRPLLYDLLESSSSRMPNAELVVLDTDWLYSSGDLYLQQLDLFSVSNFYNNPLPDAQSVKLSWHVSAGWKQRHLACQGCLDRHLTVLAGESFESGRHLVYGMAGLQVRSEKYYRGAAGAVFTAGYLGRFSHGQSLSATYRHTDGDNKLDIEYRLALGRNSDFRLGFQSDERTQRVAAGFSWYL